MFVYESFKIDRIIYYPSLNYTIAGVQYSYCFDNLVNHEYKFAKILLLPLPKDNFIPFEDLTEEIVKQWIIDNDSALEELKREYLSELYDTETPQIVDNILPWNK